MIRLYYVHLDVWAGEYEMIMNSMCSLISIITHRESRRTGMFRLKIYRIQRDLLLKARVKRNKSDQSHAARLRNIPPCTCLKRFREVFNFNVGKPISSGTVQLNRVRCNTTVNFRSASLGFKHVLYYIRIGSLRRVLCSSMWKRCSVVIRG